jgi:uncharacterized protein (TIGR02996 family)
MTERDALVRAILENPAEDTPRLAYADWLQDTGRPADAARGEFIRLQVARHNPTGDTSVARQLVVAESLRKEEALLKKWGRAWIPRSLRRTLAQDELFNIGRFEVRSETVMLGDGLRPLSISFERGFPAYVKCVVTTRATLVGPNLADWVRAALSGYPFERFRFVLDGYLPEIELDVVCDQGVRWVRWSARFLTNHQDGRVGEQERVMECDSRRDLLARIAFFVRMEMIRVEFEGPDHPWPPAADVADYEREQARAPAEELIRMQDELMARFAAGLAVPPHLLQPPIHPTPFVIDPDT